MQRQGVRSAWSAVPPTVRGAVDEVLGSPVVGTAGVAGGFSPGPAVRADLLDGRSVFLKAASATMNEDSVRMHRRERDVLLALPPPVPAPAPCGWFDDGHWVVLAVEWIDGHTPHATSGQDIQRMLSLVQLLADCTEGVHVDGIGPVGQTHPDLFGHWAQLAAERPDALDPWCVRHLDRLVELDGHAVDATEGGHLVHIDVRTDNVLLAARGAHHDVLVDWPGAAIGAPWIDLVSMLPALHLDGGPAPAQVLQSTRFAQPSWSDAIDAFLVALAGYFTRNSLEPAPPGLPTLRPFQAAQGAIARAWVGDRLGCR